MFMTQTSMPSLPPLLRRAPLLPDESLESLLLRLVVLNHCSKPAWLFSLFQQYQGGRLRPVDTPWFPRSRIGR